MIFCILCEEYDFSYLLDTDVRTLMSLAAHSRRVPSFGQKTEYWYTYVSHLSSCVPFVR